MVVVEGPNLQPVVVFSFETVQRQEKAFFLVLDIMGEGYNHRRDLNVFYAPIRELFLSRQEIKGNFSNGNTNCNKTLYSVKLSRIRTSVRLFSPRLCLHMQLEGW